MISFELEIHHFIVYKRQIIIGISFFFVSVLALILEYSIYIFHRNEAFVVMLGAHILHQLTYQFYVRVIRYCCITNSNLSKIDKLLLSHSIARNSEKARRECCIVVIEFSKELLRSWNLPEWYASYHRFHRIQCFNDLKMSIKAKCITISDFSILAKSYITSFNFTGSATKEITKCSIHWLFEFS